jgi:hypothetical protein
LEVFHTTEHRGNIRSVPIFAQGDHQWLGDGYYFWQDYEFAEEWGFNRVCKKSKYKQGELTAFDIYRANLDIEFPSAETIDTVFNEIDYYNFLGRVEYFAERYFMLFKKKPTLEDFNDFIRDFDIWRGIKAIRFQDLPTNHNRTYLKVKKFYYKKRIQIVVYDVTIIRKFALESTHKCEQKKN